MTRLMSKLLMLTILSSMAACAKEEVKSTPETSDVKAKSSVSKVDKNLIDYVKRAISVNKDFRLKDVRIRQNKEIDKLPGWSIYFLDIDLEVISQNNKIMTVHDKIFTNGKFISRDFINIVNKASLKDKIVPDMDASFYKKDHLIYGDMNAKDKIVIFSDPICPFCQGYMPDILKAIKANPKKVALFYYHFPLTMLHPEAPTIIKATMALEKKGQKDVLLKVYEQKFNINTKDETKALAEFNKKMGTKLTVSEINTQDILAHYSKDLELAGKMMINGTPTVYVNGKKDFSRNKYKTILGIK
ncbi:MAG: thioredoxin domain-containing protein [Epsilonproteobacteria bacterium]|nr:thioredoxin domain-containing protein [Campylobacterota bacterium]